MSVTRIQNTVEGRVLSSQPASNNHPPNARFLNDIAMASQTEAFAGCCITGIHHVSVHAGCPAESAEFYKEVLGMKILGRSDLGELFGAAACLSNRSQEEGHPGASFANSSLGHISLKVSSLDQLRRIYERVVEKGIPIRLTVSHGCSFAIYVGGPCGNLIEIYWPTGDRSISGRPCRGKAM